MVFLGWSMREHEPYADAVPDAGVLVSSVTVPNDENITVYAVWAADANSNGTADYEEPRYTLHYDPNGGANVPADVTGCLASTSVELATGGPTRDSAVFLGWTQTNIYATQYDRKPLTAAPDASVLLSEVEVQNADVTVYALWAADQNANGVPDYSEVRVTISFDANGGKDPSTGADGSLDPITGLLPGTVRSLPGRSTIMWQKDWNGGSSPAVFTGWSLTAGLAPCRSASDVEAAGIVSTVTMPASGNIKVYAVWAEDKNDNGAVDYLEPHYHHSYYLNTQLSTWVDDPNKPYEQNTPPLDGILPEGVARIVIDGHEIRSESDAAKAAAELLPAAESDILVGDHRRLADNDLLGERTDYDADGRELHHYVHIGWTGHCHKAAETDAETAAWRLVADEPNMPDTDGGVLRKITVGEQWAFALWALDDNHNGQADYLDRHFTLTYDPNGGDLATAPAPVTGILSLTDVILAPGPKMEGAIFLGWSADSRVKGQLYETEPDVVLLPAGGKLQITGDLILYAVWAKDTSGSVTPGPDHTTSPAPGSTDDPASPTPGSTDDPTSPTPGSTDSQESPGPGSTAGSTSPAPSSTAGSTSPAPSSTAGSTSSAPGSTDSFHTPNTGDESHAALWAALLVLCSGTLAWVLRRRRRCRG